MKKILVLSAIFFMLGCSPIDAFLPSVNARALTDEIGTIRSHYTAINKNASRYRRVKKELSGYSAEGGELEAYFDGDSIKKIVATHFGESGKAVEEFYYWDDQLIFIFRKDFHYDKPLSGKTVSTEENRFYFNNDQLIKWLRGKRKQIKSDQSEYGEKQREYLESSAAFLKLVRS